MTFQITANPDFNTDHLTSGELEDMLSTLWADATDQARARVLRKSISIEENKANIAFSKDRVYDTDERYEVELEDEDNPDLLITITCVRC